MLKPSKALMGITSVLAVAAVITGAIPTWRSVEATVSPCFGSQAAAMACPKDAPQLADRADEGDPYPLQAEATNVPMQSPPQILSSVEIRATVK